MKAVEDAVETSEKLENVADRQQHELFDTQVKRFLMSWRIWASMLSCSRRVEFSTRPVRWKWEPEYFQITVEHSDGNVKLPWRLETTDNNSVKDAIEVS
jgi:hypothetical protein